MKNIILASKRFIKKAVASFSTKKKKKMLAKDLLVGGSTCFTKSKIFYQGFANYLSCMYKCFKLI